MAVRHHPPVRRTLFLIAAIVLAEPLSATPLFSFVYFMVRDFGVMDERKVGFKAGLITSAFFLPQMLTTTPWGFASDKFGRRPILLIGLLGSAAGIVSFGLSKSMAWAIVTRGICGFFNGNTSVARTTVGELAETARLNQSKAFSLFGLCMALGYVIGPLLGGLLAKPAETVGLRGPGDIFVTFPYLLPCLVGAMFDILVFGASFFLLEETNQLVIEGASTTNPGATEAGEEDPLIESPRSGEASLRDEAKEEVHSTATTVACMLGVLFLSFHAIIFDEVYAMFAATSAESGAGLGFTPANIASSLSLMGPVIFIAQLVGFPFLNARFSTLVLWRVSAGIFVFVYPLFSLLPHVKVALGSRGTNAQWALLLTLLLVRFTNNVVGYTSISIILNRIATPEKRGATMGLAQSGVSLGRAVGPALGGAMWSWSLGNGLGAPFDSHVLFFLLLALAAAQGVSSIWLSPSAASKN
ncbi:MAG: hypothetical protein M1833_000267 [Piccolia ochrophora]|nr:MAG: hypothetical protein M1833_000267 [Piccolia ochrophora]